ncbi:putative AMP-dependent synthetase/ligase [Helianthus anomalus]
MWHPGFQSRIRNSQRLVKSMANGHHQMGVSKVDVNVYLAVIPMFHIYGLTFFNLGILSLGTKIVAMKMFIPDEMVRSIHRYGVTHFPGVSPLLTALTKAAKGALGRSSKSLKQVSCGPNTQASVVDLVTGLYLPPGKTGELWLIGLAIMKEYLNAVEATSSTIDKDGWLQTGDIVYFDQDGYLHIVGRVKEIIKYKGF